MHLVVSNSGTKCTRLGASSLDSFMRTLGWPDQGCSSALVGSSPGRSESRVRIFFSLKSVFGCSHQLLLLAQSFMPRDNFSSMQERSRWMRLHCSEKIPARENIFIAVVVVTKRLHQRRQRRQLRQRRQPFANEAHLLLENCSLENF